MRTDGTAVGYLEERSLDLAWKLAASAAIALVLVGCYCNKHIGRGLEPRARHLPRCRAYPPRLRVHQRSRPLSRLPPLQTRRTKAMLVNPIVQSWFKHDKSFIDEKV